MKDLAKHAIWRLRCKHQLGGIGRQEWLTRAGRISKRFNVKL